jgi:hypothetical protein
MGEHDAVLLLHFECMSGQANLSFGSLPSAEKDIFLCHNGADKPWVKYRISRLRT